MGLSAPVAAVLGANGQDGFYLTSQLRRRGTVVYGYGRQSRCRWSRPQQDPGYRYQCLDLADPAAVAAELVRCQPDQIYYLAAVHGSSGFSYEDHWHAAHQVNTLTPHAILEAMRLHLPKSRFVFASSSKVFAAPYPEILTEDSLRQGRCIYSVNKNATTDLIGYYRKQHALSATSVHLFNHDSALRGADYFIPKLVSALAKALQNPKEKSTLGTLCFWCDWSSAEEFMDIFADIGGQDRDRRDLCLASGRTVWGEDLATALFTAYGLDWSEHIEETFPRQSRGKAPFRVCLDRLKEVTGRTPEVTVDRLCMDILHQTYPAITAKPRL